LALERIGEDMRGRVVRLDLGLFRPYLVTKPEHVQYVLRDRTAVFLRDGMFWRPVRRLVGNGILGAGTQWKSSRRTLQPLFSQKHIGTVLAEMTDVISTAVDRLDQPARAGHTVEATAEMARIVNRTISRVFFGDRITEVDFDRLAPAIDDAANAITWRLLLPFVPDAIPLPGDRTFWRSVRTIDSVMLAHIERARADGAAHGDIVSTLCQARHADGDPLSDQEIRDDVVAMFSAGAETAAVTLSWLWVALKDHPEVAERLQQEAIRVVGSGPVRPVHLPQLGYTRMVIQELMRLYPPGWIVPRRAAKEDEIGGVRIPAGATVIVSPLVTHRMSWLWDDPHVLDPERFAPDRAAGRHRYAYFPFGGGPHQCIGSHFFVAEAQAVVAAMLSKYRPEVVNASPITAKPAASLRPRQGVEMLMRLRAAA
jgi:cytochrome P450